MHGFCDASESAYGACIYLRTTDKKGEHHVSLVCSKSRVAPIQPLTLPRLELCAALLLARLYVSTYEALKHVTFEKVCFWSDSTVSLQWIVTPPHKLKTFVSNRVAEIQEITQPHEWRHVSTLDNPADLSSRGRMPKEFLTDKFWQNGPHWLSLDQESWPFMKVQSCELPEVKRDKNRQISMTIISQGFNLLERYSSTRTLINVVAFCLRFIFNSRSGNNNKKLTGVLSADERNSALNIIIKLIQASEFDKEIHELTKHSSINIRSKLLALTPFVENGILKVGGRISKSSLTHEQKHPILLPTNAHFTNLIIREKHLEMKHAGIQTTLYSIREQYWLLDGRNAVRKIIRQCVLCSRLSPTIIDYVMRELPADRLKDSPPFTFVGVDYCGPFYIKEKGYRNTKKIKSYVSVFVCFNTKAIHLELVGDLTTDSFIGALKRFIARRGKVTTIFSDNATNFVGASRELKELYDLLNSDIHQKGVTNYLKNKEIVWKFIPPRAPHFGGLWEAAVKSFK